jgi:hypothetical protein
MKDLEEALLTLAGIMLVWTILNLVHIAVS